MTLGASVWYSAGSEDVLSEAEPHSVDRMMMGMEKRRRVVETAANARSCSHLYEALSSLQRV